MLLAHYPSDVAAGSAFGSMVDKAAGRLVGHPESASRRTQTGACPPNSAFLMSLRRKVKTALDENRLPILGARVFFGFQLQGVFQEVFLQLSSRAR
jgi:hypothetical protein